jgi:TolB protein
MKFIAVAILCFGLSSFAQEASSGIQIDVNQGKTKKSLIAFPPLQFAGNPATTKNFQSVGGEIFRVIVNDLSVSSYFQFIAQSAYLEDSSKLSIRPITADPNGFKFDSWKQIGAEFLIRANFAITGDSLTMEVFAYNVARAQVVLGKKYRGSTSNARRIGHIFSNDFMEAITGTKGMYLSKIVVASDRAGSKYKEIYTMDWDGTNAEKITNHKSIALSPAWSPDGDKVAYTAFVQRKKNKGRNADMFVYEISTGKRWLVSYRQGINSGATFHPNGKNIYLTLSQNGSPDIFKMDLEGNLGTKITNGPRGAMNVEPCISPDGNKVAFSSDRSGNPMIYVMNIDGSSPTRLTFAGQFNATPSWSPDGKKLTFAGWSEDHFDIFTMNADGSGMIRITLAKKSNGKWAQNEDPVFSPDGRHLMYTSNRTGTNQIYISNLDGSEERRVTTDNHNYFKPKWSKNIE